MLHCKEQEKQNKSYNSRVNALKTRIYKGIFTDAAKKCWILEFGFNKL